MGAQQFFSHAEKLLRYEDDPGNMANCWVR